jgi:DNA primase
MNDPVLQEIKDRLNVADVIAGYIPIKKAGTNFKALCPFHSEKTPSFQISPQKQIWHCFGCGEGGDVFGFVMKYENLDFRDALKILADKAGVKLPTFRPENKEVQDERELLIRINDFAARYYHEILIKDKRGAQAQEYLKNRGLTEGTIKQWQIGFAPDDFHALERALLAKKVNLNEAIKAGVISKNERGQMYDRFRGRVTFPIFDYFGNTVGFSARILIDDQKSAKYVNSPETSVYNKSKILFGLNFAKDAIRKADEAVIVEGQMDCISAHQAGFKNVVASSGTALTEAGLMQLSRLTKNLKFCFDADMAGQNASRRAGEIALKQGFRLKVIVLENVKDPDELIKKSPGLWEKAVAEAIWFLDWQMDFAQKKFAQDPVEQKHYLSEAVVPLLGAIVDPLEQDHYVHKLATRFLISEKTILEQIKKQVVGKKPELPQSSLAIPNGSLLLEKEVLGGLIVFPEFAKEIKDKLEPDVFQNSEIKELVASIVGKSEDQILNPHPLHQSSLNQSSNSGLGQADSGAGQARPLTSVAAKAMADKEGGGKLQDALAKEAQFMVESQLDELGGNSAALIRELFKAFAMLKIGAIKKRQQHLQNEIKNAENSNNKARIEELNREFARISAERIKFEVLL